MDSVKLAVNGTLMRGLPLEKNLLDAGAAFLREAATAPCYRLWSINDNNPAMLRVDPADPQAVSVAVEVWQVPAAGLKILGCREAKKVYTGVTAAALRAKDCMMDAVTTVRENAEDIYADAKEQNERRAAELTEEVVEDTLLSNPKAGRTGEIIIIKAEEAGPIEG